MKTAIGIVDSVRGPLHLGGLDRGPVQTPFSRKRTTIGLLRTGQRWRNRGDRADTIGPQFLMGNRNEKRRVRASTECHDDRLEFMQTRLESRQLLLESQADLDRGVGGRIHTSSVPR